MKRAIFLFNHDAPHQVAHLAGVVAAFARAHPATETCIAYADASLRDVIARLLPDAAAPNLHWHELALPGAADALLAPLNRLLPARRLARLWHHRHWFASGSILVSTERTCLKLQNWLGPRAPLFAIVPHGAGDRNVSNHPDFAKFDLLLVAGQKVVDQMLRRGIAAARLHIIGYPKFDTVVQDSTARWFDNDRPTFVYNPHFDPHLSSWFRFGPDLLRWFAGRDGQGFNLIFAPHIMLFRKKVHISLEYRRLAVRPDVPKGLARATNIHIDTGSDALIDMRYMEAADGYIGDMSSQIYEFLRRPRAAFFLNVRGAAAAREPEERHLHWRAGPVADALPALTARLPAWQQVAAEYRAAQEHLFAYTFEQTATPAPDRAAAVLARAIGL